MTHWGYMDFEDWKKESLRRVEIWPNGKMDFYLYIIQIHGASARRGEKANNIISISQKIERIDWALNQLKPLILKENEKNYFMSIEQGENLKTEVLFLPRGTDEIEARLECERRYYARISRNLPVVSITLLDNNKKIIDVFMGDCWFNDYDDDYERDVDDWE